MKTIREYPIQIDPTKNTRHQMPEGAKFVGFQLTDPGHAALWALVETDHAPQDREFALIFSGEEVPPDSRYVGTVIDWNKFVYHLFEVDAGVR